MHIYLYPRRLDRPRIHYGRFYAEPPKFVIIEIAIVGFGNVRGAGVLSPEVGGTKSPIFWGSPKPPAATGALATPGKLGDDAPQPMGNPTRPPNTPKSHDCDFDENKFRNAPHFWKWPVGDRRCEV